MVEQIDASFPDGSVIKNLPANAGDMGSISGLGTNIRQNLSQAH